MKYLLLSSFLTFSLAISAQTVGGFENFNLPAEAYLNGSDLNGGFASGDVFLVNEYNAEWMSWNGWAISNITDNTTPGFMNQYSAISGEGHGSENYATAYVFEESIIQIVDGAVPLGLYVTNSTYAYYSMLEGDAFAKKFGGVSGNDPDYFLLTIQAYIDGNLSEESVEFYLADYTFSDNSQDYIVDEWTYVDLSGLSGADSLSFQLSSTDEGEFGMNTPAYFCVDDFTTQSTVSVSEYGEESTIQLFPNPVTDFIQLELNYEPENISIFDLNGRLILQQKNTSRINVSLLPAGSYIIHVAGDKFVSSELFLKQ